MRHEEALEVLTEMEAWYKEEIYKVLSQSAICKPIAYTLMLWPRLVRYIDDGLVRIDNTPIENTIRAVALGRINYLFAESHHAAQHGHYNLLVSGLMQNQ